MSNLNLISDLENNKKQCRYQEYSVLMGFEQAKVLVPIIAYEEFEKLIEEIQPASTPQLKSILKKVNGLFEDKTK